MENTKPKEDREKEFREDLRQLLMKYGAELRVTDDGKPYGMHSAVVKVEIDGYYDSYTDTHYEYTEFSL